MPNASLFVVAGTLPLFGASCWLLMCGSINSQHHQLYPLLSLIDPTSISPAARIVGSHKQSIDIWMDPATFQINPETLQRFIKNEVEVDLFTEANVRNALPTTSASVAGHADDEVLPMDSIPLLPGRPNALKAVTPMKRMRHALKLLSRKGRPSRSAIASALPYNARTSTDPITFFRENPPRLIDIFSIPK